MIAQVQKVTGANGTLPVIIGEYGNSTDGSNIDANADEVIQAAQTSGIGAVAWAYAYFGSPADALLNADGSLSSYGQEVAHWINSAVTPSPNNTVVTAGSNAAITDAGGNRWTIVSGVVQENGQPAGYSARVIEIAYVNGVIWQENADGHWWGWQNGGWNLGNGTSTSPLLTSPNNTVIKAGSGGFIVDVSGSVWMVTSVGTVTVNGAPAGYTANVVELAYVNGSVWQENASALWWQWSGSTWSSTDGISTSPLP